MEHLEGAAGAALVRRVRPLRQREPGVLTTGGDTTSNVAVVPFHWTNHQRNANCHPGKAPHCEREFKWHHGPANEGVEQQPPWDTYYCPLCGEPAGPDSWWTQAQLELIENVQERLIGQELGDTLKDLERSTRRNKTSLSRPARSTYLMLLTRSWSLMT